MAPGVPRRSVSDDVQKPIHRLGALAGPLAELRGEPLGLGADPLLHQLAPLDQDTDLAFLLVDVDANMIHGWPLLSAALTARALLWGRLCHHVKQEVSRFIPSMRPAYEAARRRNGFQARITFLIRSCLQAGPTVQRRRGSSEAMHFV